MKALRRFGFFLPQVIGIAITTIGAMGTNWFYGSSGLTFWGVPFLMLAIAAGVVTIVTALGKIDKIPNDISECCECQRLQNQLAAAIKDRDETRQALIELKL